jgi:hypothetical protein
MAYTYKVLGQSAPSATTNTDLYTVGSGKQAIVSTLVICNRSSSIRTYRVAVRPAGETLANQHYIAYDVAVGASDSTNLSIGMTLGAADVVTIYASTTDLSFTLFGSESS